MSAPETLTYSSLVQDVIKYCERDDLDFINQIDRFISLAENTLASVAQGLGFVRVSTFQFDANTPALIKPSGWRQTKSISYVNAAGKTVFLKPRKYEYCRYYGAEAGVGEPEFFSDGNYTHFYFAATPASAFTGELAYYERPDPLSSSNQTNWTTQYAPQLMVFATLLEAQPFLKNSTQFTVWKGKFDEQIALLKSQEVLHGHDETEITK